MLRPAAAFAGLALFGSAAAAAPQVSEFSLDNGMRAVVIEDHRAPVVTHMVWYPVGAADEPWGQSGIAHFLEHLMFKGTDEIPEGAFSKIVAENGGRDNAFTSYDYTAYFQSIAADRLEIVMEMEADRMVDLVLSEDAVQTERDVILEERSQRTDTRPQGLFSEELQAQLYRNHPYGIPVIGWRHEMEQLDREAAFEFYERYYAPDNAILIVAGAVTPEEVRTLAEEHYGPLEPSGRPPEARPSEPPSRAPRRLVMEDERVRQPYVVRSYLVPTLGSGDAETAAALTVLAEVLGDGVTSRFAEKLERGDKTAIGTGAYYSASRRDAAEFTVYGVPTQGTDLETVESGLEAVLAEIAAEGPTEAELERIKRKDHASRIYAQDNATGLARYYGRLLSIGLDLPEIDAWPEKIQAVTAEDVRRVAAELLVEERSVTGWLRAPTDPTEEEQG